MKMKMKMVLCGTAVLAMLGAPAMAQDPFIPAQATGDYDAMSDQWSPPYGAWSLYDVVADAGDVAAGGPDNNFAGGSFTNWPEAELMDESRSGNQWVLGTLDMNENGIPDTYEFALATAIRFATVGDGGALLFPDFEAQWQENDLNIGWANDDDVFTWLGGSSVLGDNHSWNSQGRWYNTLATFSESFAVFFTGGSGSLFGHMRDTGGGVEGGPCCDGAGGGPYPARSMDPWSVEGEADGDIDGDGITNLQEYLDNASGTVWEFALAAITPNAGGGGGFEDVILFKGFDGDDELISGDFKGPFNFGVIDGNSSHTEVADAPVGGGTESLEYTMNADTTGTKGIAIYVGQGNAVYDISQYSYVNFYVKAPASDRAWGLTLRERSGTVPNTSDAPRAQIREEEMGTWDSHPGFVADEWSYISVPFSALTPEDGAPGSDPGFSGDFSLFTDLWMYTNRNIPAGDDQVVQFDHYTFSTTSEGGRLAGNETAPTGLPVASLFGLVTLAVGLAAGGTVAVRRRK